MSASEPQSPCISICVLDEEDICQGCFRSGTEITDWFVASSQKKQDIIDRANDRLLASRTILLK